MGRRFEVLALVFIVACDAQPFDARFAAVQKGASKTQVMNALGEPLSKADEKLPKPPFWGPSESLAEIIEPGVSYESWLYQRDRQDYYVFFAGKPDLPKEQWSVIGKVQYPTGAVFEAAPK